MTNTPYTDALRLLAEGNARHPRIAFAARRGNRHLATDLLVKRMREDITDAVKYSLDRDDDRAIAARILNEFPGPVLLQGIRTAARAHIFSL